VPLWGDLIISKNKYPLLTSHPWAGIVLHKGVYAMEKQMNEKELVIDLIRNDPEVRAAFNNYLAENLVAGIKIP
jgi:hypothetical protein